VLAVNKIVI